MTDEFPETGLYDIFITINKSGRLETSRENIMPQTWEQACRWVRVLMRVAHRGADGFTQVEDVNIARIPDAPRFEDIALRDQWLMERAAEMMERRKTLRALDAAVDSVEFMVRRGEPQRASVAAGEVLDVAVEIVCHFSEELESVRAAADRVACGMSLLGVEPLRVGERVFQGVA